MNNGARSRIIGVGVAATALMVTLAAVQALAEDGARNNGIPAEQQKRDEETRKAAMARKPALEQVQKGKDLLAAKQYEQALGAFQKVTELEPGNADGWNGQMDALGFLNRKEEAWAILDKWIAAQPKSVTPLMYKGMIGAQTGRQADALKAFEELTQIEPGGAWWAGRAEMLGCLGRKDEALAVLNEAVLKAPNHEEVWRGRGWLLMEKRKYEEAVKSYSGAIEKFPKLAEFWNGRARAYAMTGDSANALADLKKAIELRPEYKGEAAQDAAFKNLKGSQDFKDLTSRIRPLDVGMVTLADDFSAPDQSGRIWNVSTPGKIRIASVDGRLHFSAKGDKLGRADYDTRTYFAPASFWVAIDFRTGPGDDSNIALAFRNDEPGKAYRCLFVQLERSPDKGLYKAYLEDGTAANPWPHPNRFRVVNTQQQREFGDEGQKFHKLRLVYDHGSRSASAFVDEVLLGSHKIDWITDNGFSVNFAVWNDSGANRTVDVLIDNFGSNISMPRKQ